MLGLAKRLRAKILQASTSEIYGDPNVHPQTEDYWATSIRSVYAPATMKGNAVRKHCSSIGGSIDWRSKLQGSSIPVARACTRVTDVSYPISSFRRCSAVTSQSSATGR